MKTEVKPNTTEGKTGAPLIAHAYTTSMCGIPIAPPWTSLCGQKVKVAGKFTPLPDNHIKCVVCLDLATKPVD